MDTSIATKEFEHMMKTLHPDIRRRFIAYFTEQRFGALENCAKAQDDLLVRRAQGAASTYKNLLEALST